jgi:hypothetical protein
MVHDWYYYPVHLLLLLFSDLTHCSHGETFLESHQLTTFSSISPDLGKDNSLASQE